MHDLIKACKANGQEGFNALFKHYENYIYSICFRYTKSQEDALDLTQEVFIKIYNGMNRFDERRPLLPWIKRITINTCLNYVRDTKNSRFNQSLSQTDNLTSASCRVYSDVEKSLVLADTKQIIERSIQELPPEIKIAILLRHVEEMSYENIAATMAIPLGTVKTYLHRGRKLLQKKLKQCGVWEEKE